MRQGAALLLACAVYLWMRPRGSLRLRHALGLSDEGTSVFRWWKRIDPTAQAMQGMLVADLLSASIEAGLPLTDATDVVHAALAGSVRDELGHVVRAYELGASTSEAWDRIPAASTLAPVAQAVTRTYDSGAALGPVLRACAEDMRRDHRARAEIAARSAGVRAIGPLTACFLPAFLLMGVLPVIASMATQVFGS